MEDRILVFIISNYFLELSSLIDLLSDVTHINQQTNKLSISFKLVELYILLHYASRGLRYFEVVWLGSVSESTLPIC